MTVTTVWHQAFIGLGSNLDHPQQQLQNAVAKLSALPDIQDITLSPIYASQPVGPQDQPDYLNAVLTCKTSLSPQELLKQLQDIESQQGRVRSIRWGARTLDLDILLYDDLCLTQPDLVIPHPEMARRAFVLYPLADIAPAELTIGARSLSQLLAACPADGIQRIST